MATIKTINFEKEQNGQITKQVQKFNFVEIVNPKTFMEKVAEEIDIYRFAEENQIFSSITNLCMDLFVVSFRIENWEDETKGLSNDQKLDLLLDIMTDKNAEIVDIRSLLNKKEMRSVNWISKLITKNFELLMSELSIEKRKQALLLNSNPEDKLFEQGVKKFIEFDTKQSVLVDAFNNSRECFYVVKPKFSLFANNQKQDCFDVPENDAPKL